MPAENGDVAEKLLEEARELFAAYVARRTDGEEVEFEEWVRSHPQHESSLRELYAGWPRFERALGDLWDPGARARRPELREGTILGDFCLSGVLGKGGMGRVWRARQLSLDREVALKVILPERRSRRGISFFDREARAMSRVSHPGVVAVYSAGVDEGVHWIAQELVPGGRTLADFFDEARASEGLPPGYFLRVARLFTRVAEAVAAAHERGVIHRDLKPHNVLLTANGEPKVTDFGLARIVDENALSNTGDFAGTFFYMSPEQVAARRIGIDHRTDVFSLGVVLYEALTLRRPFQAETSPEVMEKILYEDPPDPCRMSEEVPRELAWICSKAMEKRRGDRFASMLELRDELQLFVAEQPIRTRPPGFARQLRRAILRHPMGSALTAVIALCLVAVGAFQWKAAAAEGRVRVESVSNALQRGLHRLEVGDVAAAAALWSQAIETSPRDPRPHLYRAYGHALSEQSAEMRREIQAAEQKGYEARVGPEATAEDLRDRALYLFCTEPDRERPRTEAALLEALKEDPHQYVAHFLLYRLRVIRGDDEGALRALREFRRWLGDARHPEFARFLAALEAELEGDFAGAARMLEELRADPEADRERVESFGVERALGRQYLRLGELDAAERELRAAVERVPSDHGSWANLARVYVERAMLAGSAFEVDELLDAADQAASRALEAAPDQLHPLLRAAQVAVARFQAATREAIPERRAEAELRVEAALAAWPDDPEVRGSAADLRIHAGHLALDERQYAASIAELTEGLGHDPDRFEGRYYLGQAYWWTQRYAESLEELDRALELCRHGPETVAGVHAWILWAAGNLGDAERCEEALARIEAELDAGVDLVPEDLLNLLEFLAAPPAGVRQFADCERVRALAEQQSFERKLEDDPELVERAEDVIRTIRGCW